MSEDKHKNQNEEREHDTQEEHLFKIDDTPENVAKSLFTLNPNEEGFEWDYLKKKQEVRGET